MTAGPAVSVIIPCYRSQDTVGGCLQALRRQSREDVEVVVVDSSPDDATAQVVRRFPEVTFVRSAERLLPHAARNRGVERAGGELLVFTDPDVYAAPDWIERLVAAHEGRRDRVVVGALACHGERWLDVGVHLCKFSKWLPGGPPRPVDVSPTANMLIHRATFAALGGFSDDHMLADALFSWRLTERGCTLWFEPRAVVEHHHLTGPRAFLRERYQRGALFGDLRSGWNGHGPGRDLLYLTVSVLPIRLPRILALVAGHCRTAGQLGALVRTLPVVVLGHAASLLGEARAYGRRR